MTVTNNRWYVQYVLPSFPFNFCSYPSLMFNANSTFPSNISTNLDLLNDTISQWHLLLTPLTVFCSLHKVKKKRICFFRKQFNISMFLSYIVALLWYCFFSLKLKWQFKYLGIVSYFVKWNCYLKNKSIYPC